MRRLAFWIVLAFPYALLAQTCGLNFSGTKDVILSTASTFPLLVRQADGSYDAGILITDPPYGISAIYSNYQNTVLNGCPASPLPISPLPPLPDPPPPVGVASQAFVIADFQNIGTPSTVAVIHNTVIFGSIVPSLGVNFLPGSNVINVAAGDFNNDGKYDFIEVFDTGQTSGSPGGVRVFLGNGDGTFKAGAVYQTGQNALFATVADLNKDGNLDIVVSGDGTSSISVLLGKGDGTFTPAASPTAGQGPVGTIAADFNNDHKLDLATANEDGTVSIFLGNGDGSFQAAKSFGCGFDCTYPASGDFNGDGNLDLAITNFDGGLIGVLLGKGDGTFNPVTLYAGGGFPTELFVADFNNDGKPDILVGEGTPDFIVSNRNGSNLAVLLGNGDGTFQGTKLVPAGGYPSWIATADFNGDGKPDFASADRDVGNVYVYLGQGNGQFQAQPAFALPSSSQGNNADPVSLAAADFNGDGKIDVAAVENIAQTLAVEYGTGTGTFQNAQSFALGTGPAAVAAGDLNGDGKADIVAANNGSQFPGMMDPGGVQVFLSTGAGFQPAKTFAAGSHPDYVAIADVNLDGKPDLVVADQGTLGSSTDIGGVSILLGNGAGAFQAPKPIAAGTNPAAVSVGDVNGDGKPDLVVLTQNPAFAFAVGVFLGNGDGTFQPPTFLAASQPGANAIIADFNGDKKPTWCWPTAAAIPT